MNPSPIRGGIQTVDKTPEHAKTLPFVEGFLFDLVFNLFNYNFFLPPLCFMHIYLLLALVSLFLP